MSISASYRSLVRSAVVTATFSVIVCLCLATNFFGWRASLPLDDPQYLALKKQLETDQDNPALQQQLHQHDAKLRAAYFRQQSFARRGAFLMLAGLLATVLLTHWALAIHRRLPDPRSIAKTSPESRQNQLGQWAVVAIVFFVASLALGSKLASRDFSRVVSDLDDDLAANAQVNLVKGESGVSQRGILDTTPPVSSPIEQQPPSAEEIAANWPRFRGASGSGVCTFEDIPKSWDGVTGEGVLWKAAVELPGVSSPIAWGERVFVTGATLERREVYCYDAKTGELAWRQSVAENDHVEVEVEQTTGHAAPTPATDGRRVYALFASGHLAAFDFDGKHLWSHAYGPLDNHYGHATSLTTYQDRLIVQLDQGSRPGDKSKLLAFDGPTGEVIWEVTRTMAATWATPIVIQQDGDAQIITCGDPWVIAYSVDDGQEIWRASCLMGEIGPSPVYADGIVYVANDNAAAAAIRTDGQGDVTESHVVWSVPYSLPDICSPLVTDRYLLLVASYGALVAYDRHQSSDEPAWEHDLDVIPFASPSLVGDQVYLIDEEGKTSIMKPGETGVERVAENELGERCSSCPAFQSGRIYIRGEQHLFCIGAN